MITVVFAGQSKSGELVQYDNFFESLLQNTENKITISDQSLLIPDLLDLHDFIYFEFWGASDCTGSKIHTVESETNTCLKYSDGSGSYVLRFGDGETTSYHSLFTI